MFLTAEKCIDLRTRIEAVIESVIASSLLNYHGGIMFKEIVFTPNEFALLAKLDKSFVPALEGQGLIKTHRKKIGNVDRKVFSLEEIQNFFQFQRLYPL